MMMMVMMIHNICIASINIWLHNDDDYDDGDDKDDDYDDGDDKDDDYDDDGNDDS